MTFYEWVERLHPEVCAQFEAWKSVGFELKYGQWVKTIRSGFSGHAGRECQYLGTHGDSKTECFGYTKYGKDSWQWGVSKENLFATVVPIDDPNVVRRGVGV